MLSVSSTRHQKQKYKQEETKTNERQAVPT